MYRRYNGSAWEDIKSVKRFDGSNWVECSSVKKYDGSNWVDVFKREVDLLDDMDRWKIIDQWLWSGHYGTYTDRYIKSYTNPNYFDMYTINWTCNGGIALKNPIDLTSYSKVNFLYDICIYQTASYTNGAHAGWCEGPLTYYCGNTNPPIASENCNGYTNKVYTLDSLTKDSNNIWYYDREKSFDVSSVNKSVYIFFCPISWNVYGDWTKLKLKRVWLS